MVRKFLKRSRQIGSTDSAIMRFDIPKRAILRYLIIEFQDVIMGNGIRCIWMLLNTKISGALSDIYAHDGRVEMRDGFRMDLTTSGALSQRYRYISPLYGMSMPSQKNKKLGLWGGLYHNQATGKRIVMTLVYDI